MKKMQSIMLAGVLAMTVTACADKGQQEGVSFVGLNDGATVAPSFKVKMAVEGMQVHKAGDLVEGTGHFHLIIDAGCIKKGETIVNDASHKHYGKAQTETELTLTPGEHTLSLQLADGHHVSYGKSWCKSIHLTVK